jgi:hypothetical protein
MSKRPIAAFSALVKKTLFAPPLLARLQTDGSFRYNDHISRTASLLKTDETYKSVKTYFDHKNSYESEWCSVKDGILMTQECDVDSVQIENDNLSIGVKCANCALYEGNGVCKIVAQTVEDNGYCRLAAIYDGVVKSGKSE